MPFPEFGTIIRIQMANFYKSLFMGVAMLLLTTSCLGRPTSEDGLSLDQTRIFVTKNVIAGSLGGLGKTPDQYCQDAASAAGLDRVYRALVSNNTNSAKQKLTFFGDEIYKVNSAGATFKVANNAADLWDGTALYSAIDLDEYGNAASGYVVFTGTQSTGDSETGSSPFCTNWTSADSGMSTRVGNSSATDSFWVSSALGACRTASHFYCISQ